MLYFLSLPIVFGVPIFLGTLNSRITRKGAWAAILLTLGYAVVLPYILCNFDYFNKGRIGVMETAPKTVVVKLPADSLDVAEGKAQRIGQAIPKNYQPLPQVIFYRGKERVEANNPQSEFQGVGKFNVQLYTLHLLGVDLQSKDRATLRALEYFFNIIFAVFVLFLVSYLTRQEYPDKVRRFFIKLHTPVEPDAEKDALALEAAYADPDGYVKKKVFPGSNWEMNKPRTVDWVGFLATCAASGLIVFLLYKLIHLGS
jgi:SSS family solute:Na+ symporter